MGRGELAVKYDGISFTVVSVVGDVYMNNAPAKPGDTLHKACVLTFGSNGAGRSYVQFASSHPEVIL
jgi:eukaryotic-like serine/threonine-protein kinase